MKHRIEVLRRILRLLYEMLFTMLLVYFITIIFMKEKPPVFALPIIFVFYVVSYLTREYAPNNLIVLLIHAALGVTAVFLPVGRGFIAAVLATDLYLLGESFLYIRRNAVLLPLSDMPWPTFLISFIIYLYGFYTHSSLLTISAYLIPLILIVLYLLTVYTDGIKAYLEATKDVSGLPVRRMLSANTMIVAVILAVICVLFAVNRFFNPAEVLVRLGEGVIAAIRILLFGIAFIGRLFASLLDSDTAGESFHYSDEGQQVRKYAGTFGSSVETVLKLLLAALAVYLLFRLLRRIFRRLLTARSSGSDIVEEAVPMRASGLRQEHLKKRLLYRLSAEERMRNMYKNRILRHKYDISFRDNKTGRMLADEIRRAELGDVDELTGLYEDVRYGNVTVDKTMIRRMKRLTRK